MPPLLPLSDPNAQNLSNRLKPPSLTHPLGTDELGREIDSRVIYGARTTFLVALVASLIGGVAGTGLGLHVARGIVQDHGGALQVESKIGEGSKFTISLPRVSE